MKILEDTKTEKKPFNGKERMSDQEGSNLENKDSLKILQNIWNNLIEPKIKESFQNENELVEELQNEEDISNTFGNDEKALRKWVNTLIEDYVTMREAMKNHTNMREMTLTTKSSKMLSYTPEFEKIEPRFFFGLCSSSRKLLDNPKVCSGCLSVAYSNKEEQVKHWKKHKSVCKALQPIVKYGESGHHPLHTDPASKSKQTLEFMSQNFRRSLNQEEMDLINYPRLCMVCLSGRQSSMIDCSKCHCVAYCSKEHLEEDASEHEKSCSLLRICIEDYQQEILHQNHPSQRYFPRISRLTYEPIGCKRIDEFFMTDLNRHVLKTEEKDRSPSELRALTFRYTGPLTVLDGLELSVASLGEKAELTLEIVGARVAETNDISKWEMIPLRLPKLKKITFIFIGPEMTFDLPGDNVVGSTKYLKSLRPDLEQRFVFCKKDYTNYEKKWGSTYAPDLISVLNCGFVFYSSWDPCIPRMMTRGGALLFTEYYLEDAEMNLNKIKELYPGEAKVLKHPSPNSFCSSLPARIPTGFAFRKFKRRNVVLSNDFICVLKKDP